MLELVCKASSSRVKRFHMHYAGIRHYSTGSVGGPLLFQRFLPCFGGGPRAFSRLRVAPTVIPRSCLKHMDNLSRNHHFMTSK